MHNIERWVRVAQMVETARDGASTAGAKVVEWNRVLVPVLGMAMVLAVLPAIASEAPPTGVSHDTQDDVLWGANLREANSPLVPGLAMTAVAPRLPENPVGFGQARVSRHPVPASVRADAHALLHAVGVPHEDAAIYGEDLVEAAKKSGKSIAPNVDVERVEYLLAVHRNQAGPAVRAAGVNPGTRVDLNDIARAAHAMGLKVGQRVDPSDVERLKEAVQTRWKQSEARRAARAEQRRQLAAGVSGNILSKVDGVTLAVPSDHARLVGFHQAAYRVARNMRPGGGRGMLTLPSRGRGTGRRTAADVSVPRRTPIVSPVSGRVVEVRRYRLYGRYADVRIRIVPYSNSRRLVTVLHVSDPRVRVGSRVEAGRTVIAGRATAFPFRSQIDKHAGRNPHVHVEVRTR
ncbi:MAG: M23 family metallopeptidase [Nitriliruptorales bacterium]